MLVVASVRLDGPFAFWTHQADFAVLHGNACGFHQCFQGESEVHADEAFFDLWHWVRLARRMVATRSSAPAASKAQLVSSSPV